MSKNIRFIATLERENGSSDQIPFRSIHFEQDIGEIKNELCDYLEVDHEIDDEELKIHFGRTLVNSILNAPNIEMCVSNVNVQKCVFIFQYYYHLQGIFFDERNRKFSFPERQVIEGDFIENAFF